MNTARPEFLDLAIACGATLTGLPDGSQSVTVVFSGEAWRKFDASLQKNPSPLPDLSADGDGDIALDWRVGTKMLSLSISPVGNIHYSWLTPEMVEPKGVGMVRTHPAVYEILKEVKESSVNLPEPAFTPPPGYVLVKAYKVCGRYADDAPGLRADCARKIKAGNPCEKCPTPT